MWLYHVLFVHSPLMGMEEENLEDSKKNKTFVKSELIHSSHRCLLSISSVLGTKDAAVGNDRPCPHAQG